MISEPDVLALRAFSSAAAHEKDGAGKVGYRHSTSRVNLIAVAGVRPLC